MIETSRGSHRHCSLHFSSGPVEDGRRLLRSCASNSDAILLTPHSTSIEAQPSIRVIVQGRT